MPLPAAGEKKSWVRAPYRENFARLFSLGPRVRAPYRELGNLNSSSLRSVRLVLPEREPEIGSVRLCSRSIVCCFLFPAACPALAPHASQELQRSSLASPSPCVFFGAHSPLGAGRLERSTQSPHMLSTTRQREAAPIVSLALPTFPGKPHNVIPVSAHGARGRCVRVQNPSSLPAGAKHLTKRAKWSCKALW